MQNILLFEPKNIVPSEINHTPLSEFLNFLFFPPSSPYSLILNTVIQYTL